MPPVILSTTDVALLQHVIDKERRDRVNLPPRPPMERSFSEAEDHQAPEVYVAKPQTDAGIPKLLPSGTGTGTDVSGSSYDEPGVAECDIYQILVDATSGDPELHVIGLNLNVHNLSASDLEQGWITVIRTKFGKWVAVTADSGETITVVTNIRVDTATLTIQKKTRQVKVIPVGDESDWIDVHTGVDCSDTGTGS